MYRRHVLRCALSLAALAAPAIGLSADAGAALLKVGDKVVTTRRAPVVKGEETLATLEAGTELTVTTVQGAWIGVQVDRQGQKVAGWLQAAHVRAAPVGPAKPPAGPDSPPRELAMQSLPAYCIEPPDLLQIEVLKLVPLPPYRVEVYDVLQIRVLGTIEDQRIDGPHLVDGEGTVNLGPAYGKVRVAGMTLEQAEAAIHQQLRLILRAPEVSVELARAAATQPVTGVYMVCPDGTINLRQYGSVYVAGKTPVEARLALQRQLGQFFDSPEVTVDVAGYNSKVYYVITESADQGENVVRVPISGKETVLDAISQIGGLPKPSSRKIWLVRPTPPESGKEIRLPVDWQAITRRGNTATNYQVMPGDRLIIAQEKEEGR